MHSKSTRIAYLKRMLKRLEGEDVRVQELVVAMQLTPEEAKLVAQQLNKSREELLAELRSLNG